MKKEAISWFNQAEKDLKKAEILFKNLQYDGATFYSQQAAEKSLKALCISKGLGLIKTHDLSLLGKKLELPLTLLEKAILLNPFYTSSRYPLVAEEQDVSNKENAKLSINYAKEILKWCKEKIRT